MSETLQSRAGELNVQVSPASSVEKARVVSVQRRGDSGYSTVWVEAFQRSTCGECAARDACGQGVLGRWFARKQRHYSVRCEAQRANLLAVGQWVEIAIPEGALVRAALLAYLLPVAGLLLGAMASASLSLADWATALFGMLGFYAGFLLARRLAERSSHGPATEPVLLGCVSS